MSLEVTSTLNQYRMTFAHKLVEKLFTYTFHAVVFECLQTFDSHVPLFDLNENISFSFEDSIEYKFMYLLVFILEHKALKDFDKLFKLLWLLFIEESQRNEFYHINY